MFAGSMSEISVSAFTAYGVQLEQLELQLFAERSSKTAEGQ